MEKTTVRISTSLKRDIDVYVAGNGLTFHQVFNVALRNYLKTEEKRTMPKGKWVKSLTALNLGKEGHALTRENLYKKDEDLT